MGKLIVTEFLTLDGVAQAPGGPDEDRDSGFTHGGWQAPLLDEESGNAVFEQAKSMDALLLGRTTYEIFADYWPTAREENPFAALLNGVPKYVASRTLAGPLTWEGSTLVTGDFAESITAVKERHDRLHVIGRGEPAGTEELGEIEQAILTKPLRFLTGGQRPGVDFHVVRRYWK